MSDRKVFFIADDFGMNAEVNRAVVEAHLRGVLHGASLMLGQPGTADAVRMAQQNPSLPVGWHLHLDNSQPVTCAAWPWGNSYRRAGWAIGLSRRARQLMREEVRAQWNMFGETGLTCAFVNSHHHLHAHPFVYRTLLDVLGSSFHGWLRLGQPRFFSPNLDAIWIGPADWLWMGPRRRRCPYRCSDTVWGLGRTFRMQAGEVARAIQRLGPGFHEFYFHPRSTANDDWDLRCLRELKTCEF
ncbi:MAG: ChbG/HpnK family deacetylase [Verrucomicrobiia bacterium]